ncbi:hypothetical protein [Streptomyces sp. XD-27]|uniref:hypothetical protein n=1 Tax=Streptomyces sp. XD-27 TaxID=3062779 RepID=UPI0026F45A02|nr:hypothetical protein [Streptomyces sp. XD-27]WKX69123.1 hypothetical protein Q3Y56_03590 [Streptomyces sp. XD-27]
MRDFIDTVRSRIPSAAPAVGVELAAAVQNHHRIVREGGINGLLADRQWTHPPAANALDQAFTEWTRPGFLSHAAALADLNVLAYALSQANRPADAAAVFTLIEGRVTAWPWRLDGDPLRQYAHWRERALR